MSTPPIANHSLIREKLRAIVNEVAERRVGHREKISKLAHECSVLLESEQGIQNEVLVGISKYPCISALLGERTEEDEPCGCAACVAGYALRGNRALVRAILCTESEGA